MTRTKATPGKLVRRLAVLACVATLGVSAAACGSDSKPEDSPAVTTTTPATDATTTTAPTAGGAGF